METAALKGILRPSEVTWSVGIDARHLIEADSGIRGQAVMVDDRGYRVLGTFDLKFTGSAAYEILRRYDRDRPMKVELTLPLVPEPESDCEPGVI